MGDVTFIRIPKNASTSLYAFFGMANTVRNEYLNADNDHHLNIFEPSHQSVADLENNLGTQILDSPVLAVVRNPYERLVSMYFFARKHDLGMIYDIDTSDFTRFARGFYRLSADERFFHAMPQWRFMEHPRSGEFTVVRFEDLQDGIKAFIEHNELSFDTDNLECLNTTEHEHYSTYYNDETKGIVKNMWGCDLRRFSYSFEQR